MFQSFGNPVFHQNMPLFFGKKSMPKTTLRVSYLVEKMTVKVDFELQ